MVVGIGRVGGRGAWPEDSQQQSLQFIYTLLLILAKATYSWCFIHSLFLCKNLNAACADFSRFVKNFLCLLFSKAGLKRLLNTREPFNPIQDGPFWGRSRMGGGAKRLPSLKSVTHILQRWHSYILPKEDPPKILITLAHLLSSADINIFLSEISKFCYIRKYKHRLHFGKNL